MHEIQHWTAQDWTGLDRIVCTYRIVTTVLYWTGIDQVDGGGGGGGTFPAAPSLPLLGPESWKVGVGQSLCSSRNDPVHSQRLINWPGCGDDVHTHPVPSLRLAQDDEDEHISWHGDTRTFH